ANAESKSEKCSKKKLTEKPMANVPNASDSAIVNAFFPILRHMKILEDSGLIETYTQESNLRAPDRKYYRLATTYRMNIAFSRGGFFN
ncbi:MAG: hypothetical protein ACXWFB_01370, partial [Nitrososphaeraceae archaeon]